jgi:hypothetical protein
MGVKWAKVTNDGSVLLLWKTNSCREFSDDIKMKKYLELWHEVNSKAKAKPKRDPKLAGSAVRKLIDKLKVTLKKWPNKAHPYYKDIQKIVKESSP